MFGEATLREGNSTGYLASRRELVSPPGAQATPSGVHTDTLRTLPDAPRPLVPIRTIVRALCALSLVVGIVGLWATAARHDALALAVRGIATASGATLAWFLARAAFRAVPRGPGYISFAIVAGALVSAFALAPHWHWAHVLIVAPSVVGVGSVVVHAGTDPNVLTKRHR